MNQAAKKSISLTDEQKHIIAEVVQLKKEQQTIAGYAGTGKTTILAHVIKVLPDFAVAAYTGKAANVLRRKGIESASTIHSLIYEPEKDDNGNIIYDRNGNVNFVRAESLPCAGIIIDEASMVSKEIYDDLCSFGKPIIFVGDHGQLPPIGSDFNLMKDPDYRLEQIHRNAGEIAHFADWIRQGYRPAAFSSRKAVEFVSKSGAKHYYPNVDQIICAFNKTRVEINDVVRKQKKFSGLKPETGEKVMCLRNNRKTGVFNGMQGYIKEFIPSRAGNNIRFLADNEKTYDLFIDLGQFGQEKYEISTNRDDPDPFDWAYAITCHKSQGDQFDSLLVIEQMCALWEHVRWAYTAASRAVTKVYWAS